MYTALSPYAIGVRVANIADKLAAVFGKRGESLHKSIAAAQLGGFQGVEINPNEIADLVEQEGVESVRALFTESGIRPAGFGLPVDFRTTEANWRAGLNALPRQAKAAAAIGCTRTMTWISPASDTVPFEENRRFHIERFTPIAAILAEQGISLGLEFIGPKTLRDGKPYPFIYTMEAMLEMGQEIGPNVGLLLDCWHWYTSHSTVEALRALRPEQVVYVHVNDAPAGVPIDEQLDNVRCLPGETGVIDITGFLQALQAIGYDGPVTPEPFKKELNDLPSDEARLRTVGEAMQRIFQNAGIGN
jgi:sugar phosphate isomerase/epimerase